MLPQIKVIRVYKNIQIIETFSSIKMISNVIINIIIWYLFKMYCWCTIFLLG